MAIDGAGNPTEQLVVAPAAMACGRLWNGHSRLTPGKYRASSRGRFDGSLTACAALAVAARPPATTAAAASAAQGC